MTGGRQHGHPRVPDNKLLWTTVRLTAAAAALLCVLIFVPDALTSFGVQR